MRFGDWVEVGYERYFVIYMSKRPVRHNNVIKDRIILTLVAESDVVDEVVNPVVYKFTLTPELHPKLPPLRLDQIRVLGRADLKKQERIVYALGDTDGARRVVGVHARGLPL